MRGMLKRMRGILKRMQALSTLLARHAVEVEACARGFEEVLGRERVAPAREAEEREEDAGSGGSSAEDDVAGVPDRCSSGVSI